jgi:hypothetical protein
LILLLALPGQGSSWGSSSLLTRPTALIPSERRRRASSGPRRGCTPRSCARRSARRSSGSPARGRPVEVAGAVERVEAGRRERGRVAHVMKPRSRVEQFLILVEEQGQSCRLSGHALHVGPPSRQHRLQQVPSRLLGPLHQHGRKATDATTRIQRHRPIAVVLRQASAGTASPADALLTAAVSKLYLLVQGAALRAARGCIAAPC